MTKNSFPLFLAASFIPTCHAATAVFQWVADLTPGIPGVSPGTERPKAILAGDIDYPPYSYIGDASTGFVMDGFAVNVARGLEEVCDIDVFVGQTRWADCWDNTDGVEQIEQLPAVRLHFQRAGLLFRFDDDGFNLVQDFMNQRTAIRGRHNALLL